MPTLYLSPSTQEGNPVVIGGTEEEYMNRIADAMEPYLVSNGIVFRRNNRNESLGQAIRDSNAGNYDLHFALHSNAAPPTNSGNVKGADFYYYAPSTKGREAATILAENYKRIYPYPELSRPIATTSLVELRTTRAPAVLAELAYHDNVEEATDGQEALAKLRAGHFGLVISDWNMQPMTGLDLLKEVRAEQRLKETPFIMITAESKTENVSAAKQAGVSN